MKYVHTNLISKDWKALAGFYIQVFECKLLLPQRDLSGDWLSKGTNVKNAHLKGAHLRLPGYGKTGPTLELFEYSEMEEQASPISNRHGFGHIAFEVNDVQQVLDKALKFGGTAYGTVAKKEMEGLGTLTFIYIKDPEGNIIEIQNWGRAVEMPQSNTNTSSVPKEKAKTTQASISKTTKKIDANDDLILDKRAYLNSLQDDLDDAKRLVRSAKNEIELTKEEALDAKRKTHRTLKTTPESLDTHIPKTKAELLEELKQEMKISDKKIVLGSPKKQPPKEKTQNPIDLNPTDNEAKLNVEIRIGQKIQPFNISQLKLNQTTTTIAINLRAFTSISHPEHSEMTLLEWIGKQYKADLVPLMKQVKKEQSKEQNDKNWALLPRLIGSLEHFINKCKESPETLLGLNLNTIDLTNEGWRNTFENLQKIALEAEKKSATHIRFNYSK